MNHLPLGDGDAVFPSLESSYRLFLGSSCCSQMTTENAAILFPSVSS